MMRFVLLLVLGCMAAEGDALGKKTGGKAGGAPGKFKFSPAGKKVGANPSASALGKLRMSMLTWYCEEQTVHAEERPCKNMVFMQQMRKAESAEARKALVTERSKSLPSDEEGRKQLAQQSRMGYVQMYKAYCAQENPKNAEVCTNQQLKKMYDSIEKGPQPPSKL